MAKKVIGKQLTKPFMPSLSAMLISLFVEKMSPAAREAARVNGRLQAGFLA